MLQPCTFIESIKWQFLNKWYSVNYYVVTLCSKLYSLALLASDYRSDVRFADAYNSIRDALARVTTIKVILLLSIYPRDNFKHVQMLVVQQFFIGMDTHLPADLTEYLLQQRKQSHYHLPCLLVSMLALFPISKVCFLNIIVLRSHPALSKPDTDAAHHLVCPFNTFPE